MSKILDYNEYYHPLFVDTWLTKTYLFFYFYSVLIAIILLIANSFYKSLDSQTISYIKENIYNWWKSNKIIENVVFYSSHYLNNMKVSPNLFNQQVLLFELLIVAVLLKLLVSSQVGSIVSPLLFGLLINFYKSLSFVVINFYSIILPTILIVLASSIVLFKNPVYSLLSLTTVFLVMGGLLIGHAVEFFSIIFLIVYVGAISILFLFVIMMFNLKKLADAVVPNYLYTVRIVGILFISKFFSTVTTSIYFWLMESTKNSRAAEFLNDYTIAMNWYADDVIFDGAEDFTRFNDVKYLQDALSINEFFYNSFGVKFILIAFVLLTAMIGALTMCVSFHVYISNSLNNFKFSNLINKNLLAAVFFVPSTEVSFFDYFKDYAVDCTFSLFNSYEIAYVNLAILGFLALCICSLLIFLAYILSLTTINDMEQLSEYECGFEPFDSATRHPFDVHFYIIGILFLIFDVELAVIFPWVLDLYSINWYGFWIMMYFLIILTVGFFYEWYQGALSWPNFTLRSRQ